MDERILEDLAVAEKMLGSSSGSIVVVKNGQVITTKQGKGIKPILDTIDELGEQMHGCVVGDRILGKASSFLCVYAKVSGVYSPQATKTAIAVLIRAGIPCQADKLIPFIQNRNGDGICPFEQLLSTVESADEAYVMVKDYFERKKEMI